MIGTGRGWPWFELVAGARQWESRAVNVIVAVGKSLDKCQGVCGVCIKRDDHES